MPSKIQRLSCVLISLVHKLSQLVSFIFARNAAKKWFVLIAVWLHPGLLAAIEMNFTLVLFKLILRFGHLNSLLTHCALRVVNKLHRLELI